MNYIKKRLIIIGGSGFVGQEALNYFNTFFQVYSLSRSNPDKRQGDIEYLNFDIFNLSSFFDKIKQIKPHFIINLIGTNNPNFTINELISINTDFPRQLMQNVSALHETLQKILFVGSAAEYGNALPYTTEEHPLNPINPYGLSKSIQSNYFKYFSKQSSIIKYSLIRPFNIVHSDNPENTAIGSFIKKIKETKNNSSFNVNKIDIQRDYVSLDDLCKAMHLVLINNNNHGEVFNVCSGTSYTLKSILNYLIEKSGKKLSFIENNSTSNNTIEDSCGSNKKIFEYCDWKPIESIFDVLNKVIF